MCATSVAERQVRFAVAILVAVLVATACSQRGPEAYDDVLPSPAQDEDGADTDEDTEDADEPESEDGLDLDERDDTYLFDQSKLHTFDIELSEADLAILDARKMISFARDSNVPIVGVIENMSTMSCPHCNEKIDVFKKGGGKKLAEELVLHYLGSIPLDGDIV